MCSISTAPRPGRAQTCCATSARACPAAGGILRSTQLCQHNVLVPGPPLRQRWVPSWKRCRALREEAWHTQGAPARARRSAARCGALGCESARSPARRSAAAAAVQLESATRVRGCQPRHPVPQMQCESAAEVRTIDFRHSMYACSLYRTELRSPSSLPTCRSYPACARRPAAVTIDAQPRSGKRRRNGTCLVVVWLLHQDQPLNGH